MPKVLISDDLSPRAAQILAARGVEVDMLPGITAEELKTRIAGYDGLAVRSATKVTAELLGRRAEAQDHRPRRHRRRQYRRGRGDRSAASSS